MKLSQVNKNRKNNKIPNSLYIPPDALEIYLDIFSGPLDLLLYFIRQKNLEISEISLKKITDQYLAYIQNISHIKFELVAEYLLMAALLAEIKSRDLLPKTKLSLDEEEQKLLLLENLRQYAILSDATQKLNEIKRLGRDWFECQVRSLTYPKKITSPIERLNDIDIHLLKKTFEKLLIKKQHYQKYQVEFEPISVSEKMNEIMNKLRKVSDQFIRFEDLLNLKEGRLGLVVQLVSLLELVKDGAIDIQQQKNGGIYAKVS